MSSSSSSSALSSVPYSLNNSPTRGSNYSGNNNLISDIIDQSSYNIPSENDNQGMSTLSSSSTSLSQKDNNNNNNNDYLNQKSEWRCEHTVESDGPVVSTEHGTYSP